MLLCVASKGTVEVLLRTLAKSMKEGELAHFTDNETEAGHRTP